MKTNKHHKNSEHLWPSFRVITHYCLIHNSNLLCRSWRSSGGQTAERLLTWRDMGHIFNLHFLNNEYFLYRLKCVCDGEHHQRLLKTSCCVSAVLIWFLIRSVEHALAHSDTICSLQAALKPQSVPTASSFSLEFIIPSAAPNNLSASPLHCSSISKLRDPIARLDHTTDPTQSTNKTRRGVYRVSVRTEAPHVPRGELVSGRIGAWRCWRRGRGSSRSCCSGCSCRNRKVWSDWINISRWCSSDFVQSRQNAPLVSAFIGRNKKALACWRPHKTQNMCRGNEWDPFRVEFRVRSIRPSCNFMTLITVQRHRRTLLLTHIKDIKCFFSKCKLKIFNSRHTLKSSGCIATGGLDILQRIRTRAAAKMMVGRTHALTMW